MKVVTVVGTRPELIRLSRVVARLDDEVDHVLVHTGQNWDPRLRDVFFSELGIRPADHALDVPVSSLGATLAGVLTGTEQVLRSERPDALLVLGDTNSAYAAVMAKRMGVPVFHMEAGNRSFDENVPEETNRRIVDHVADFNLCYTEHARRHLLAEGLPARRTFVTGSPLPEVFAAYRDQVESSDVLSRLGLAAGGYYVVSMHREENVDDPGRLAVLTSALSKLARDTGRRVVVSAHPRLRARLETERPDGLELLDPFGYVDYQALQLSARCVLSDSGSVSEEALIEGFPAVTIRDSMERPEALDAGGIVLSGVSADGIRRAVDLVCAQWDAGVRPSVPEGYLVTDCSVRVTRLVTGLAGVHTRWLGLNGPPRWER
jgi:UDP-N-acetylglucosamine 2-epimerase (non-hydrolysing)